MGRPNVGDEGDHVGYGDALFAQAGRSEVDGPFLELAFPPMNGDPREEALSIEGLGRFRKDVLFCKVKSDGAGKRLRALQRAVLRRFHAEVPSLLLDNDKRRLENGAAWTPHATVMKNSVARRRLPKGAEVPQLNRRSWKHLEFRKIGKQPLSGLSLDLCAMMHREELEEGQGQGLGLGLEEVESGEEPSKGPAGLQRELEEAAEKATAKAMGEQWTGRAEDRWALKNAQQQKRGYYRRDGSLPLLP